MTVHGGQIPIPRTPSCITCRPELQSSASGPPVESSQICYQIFERNSRLALPYELGTVRNLRNTSCWHSAHLQKVQVSFGHVPVSDSYLESALTERRMLYPAMVRVLHLKAKFVEVGPHLCTKYVRICPSTPRVFQHVLKHKEIEFKTFEKKDT